jgi:phage tail-like protein
MLQADEFCVRFTKGLDPILAPILSTIDNVDAYVDPWLTPPDFLDWLAGWFGLELDATWPEERRRALVANALELGRWRGTVIGLAMLVELYTGAPAEIEDGGAVVASDDPAEPLPGAQVDAVTVHYVAGAEVDAPRLQRLARDAVPAQFAVQCVPRAMGTVVPTGRILFHSREQERDHEAT